MENKLLFLSAWSTDKIKTWSGTTWQIYSALKNFFEVEKIDLTYIPSLRERIRTRILRTLHIIPQSDMGLGSIAKKKEIVKNSPISTKNFPVFQFEEIVDGLENKKTFMYIDMSADATYNLYKRDRKAFLMSNYSKSSLKSIEKRARQQNKYLENCSAVFSMGKWLAKDLVDRTGIPQEKVVHAGAGVNLDVTLIDDTKKNGNKILFVGRDFRRKGGEITLEAFKILKNRCPEAELYVAGPQTDPYKGKNISGYHFLGDCDKKKLSNIFNMCDIFCMPSYFEAYGMVFIEALTYGLPCIGRNCFEMPYFIDDGKTGYLIEDDNVEKLAVLMEKLLHDAEIHNIVRSKRNWYITEYSWNTVAKRMAAYIDCKD